MSSTPITHLYRSVLREIRLSSRSSRSTRSPVVSQHVRTLVASTSDKEILSRTLLETRDFLRSTRIHAELLKRYNPIHGMSEEERIKATANRVGLNTPIEYKNE
ncbi:uncharacterized protein I303_108162 [Kwoniella dejecticola CBS 10117]|uniref:Uncharacterized protein n=1 Tax=Kwoniella dejecticola CBS 10117 TaxID=1296121 RepID=A0A1A5ZY54_9TREE|nr:uncharacterized protein I303_07512 [Kwoniella dejecticola CBS 10117]OBR82745.1 hypothetical protein I303_07512 [Kwoniella dejecticola CBS 10117]